MELVYLNMPIKYQTKIASLPEDPTNQGKPLLVDFSMKNDGTKIYDLALAGTGSFVGGNGTSTNSMANSINYKYRVHDPRLGRFLSIDPLASKYPHNSPYAFSENRVMDAIELEGLEAWEIKNTWSPEYVEKYRAAFRKTTAELLEQDIRLTCEDFALHILIDFASKNSLPVTVINGTGTYSAGSSDFNSVDQFRTLMFNTTGANDLKRITKIIGYGETGFKHSQVGDIVLLDYENNGRANHTQMIFGNNASQSWVFQGNTLPYTSSKVNSPLYGGLWLQEGVWDFKNDTYNNFYKNSLYEDPFNTLFPSIHEWNFEMFNGTNGDGPIIDSPIENGGGDDYGANYG